MHQEIVRLYTASESSLLDQVAIETDQLMDGTLMERAGEAAYRHLRFLWPRARTVVLVCGPGNNGGDGYVLARKLLEAEIQSKVYSVGILEDQKGDALSTRKAFEAAGGVVQRYQPGNHFQADVVVDALLGTGSQRELGGDFADVVNTINRSGLPVLALDIPSGIDPDTGRTLGVAVRAQATLSFISLKRGCFTSEAVDYTGSLYFSDLGISSNSLNKVSTNAFLITAEQCRQLRPVRLRNTYKSKKGNVLVIGGIKGMSGAAVLAGQSALVSGAGLVRIASQATLDLSWPELMMSDLSPSSELKQLVTRADVLAVGPGLGRDKFAHQVLGHILDFRGSNQALVLDADALICLARESIEIADAILTPHPGEAAKLLACSIEDVQRDRFAAAKEIAQRYKSICILKGAGTVISDGAEFHVCERGGPELATAGTGDVLTGLVAAFVANGLPLLSAAKLAVYVHAVAAELCTERNGGVMVASDLIRNIPIAISQLDR